MSRAMLPLAGTRSGVARPTRGTHTVVMVRNGSCEWNEENRFPSWVDTRLSEAGRKVSRPLPLRSNQVVIEEGSSVYVEDLVVCVQAARQAGETLKKAGYQFDVAFTSVLTRAHETLHIILELIGQLGLPVHKTWLLNDRHYGALTGLNRAELSATYGEDQMRAWRRSYAVAPPPMRPNHPYYRDIVDNPIYSNGPQVNEFPVTESLRMTFERTVPFWMEVVVPHVQAGERVLVCAHGNSLRGLIKHLEDISNHGIAHFNIPMCIPFVYELDDSMVPVEPLRFLAESDVLMDATEAIEAQIASPK